MISFLKKHYHWIIAAVALLQLLIYGGAVNNYTSYHMIPVSASLEISRTAFTLTTSMRAVVSMLCTLFSGYFFQRFGYRKVVTVGLICAGLSYVVYTTMGAYWMLVAGSLLAGVSHGICSTAGVSRLVNVWFHKYRGTVLGVIAAATGLGSMLLGFVQAWAIEYVSWRMSFAIVSGLMLLMALIVYISVRNEPKDMGLAPYGDGEITETKTKKRSFAWEGFSMGELKKSPSFYLLIVCAFFSCMCIVATQYNLVPYLQDCGVSTTRTSMIYGVMMLVLSFIKLGMGALCDAIGTKRVMYLCHIACAAGLIMVLTLPKTNGWMIAAFVVYDLGIPLTTMMFPLLSVELLGNQSQAQYIGVVMAMVSAGNIVSGPLANVVRDTVGSYAPAFWGVAILAIALNGLYLLLFALTARDRKKLPTWCV